MTYMSEDVILQAKTDIELYKDFLQGNREAFNMIIRRYRKSLIAFIMKYVRSYEAAEDLAQDTFVYVLVNQTEYDFKYSLRTYLYTIAKCRAINYLKKQKRVALYDEAYMQEESFEMEDELLKIEEKKKLYSAMKKLKRDYKIAVYLRDILGFDNKEVSKILNKTMPQTKMIVYRGRKALEKNLRKENEIC